MTSDTTDDDDTNRVESDYNVRGDSVTFTPPRLPVTNCMGQVSYPEPAQRARSTGWNLNGYRVGIRDANNHTKPSSPTKRGNCVSTC